jgi:Fe-S-cluster-containing dehydrogenase component/formate-dependent nitrite reductase membrane component NrfD
MRYGFVIDQDRCIGCHACTVACKEEHQVPVGVFRTWVKYVEKGEFPHTRRHFGVMRCNHCDSAPCIEICPTHALYRRSDGIVDFDNQRCIGCKGCMQACPYDALYIDPNTNTAAKCNFCAHRVEANLEPACVIVCPTQAIIAGDLDNPAGKASRIVATEKISVRKPQKGTEPKLFYKGIEGDLLEPTRLSRQSTYVFAEQRDGRGAQEKFDPAVTREVYDVAHPAPWGWKISAYLWTKSIAAGLMLVAALCSVIFPDSGFEMINVAAPAAALIFLAVTLALLVFDLKRPDRFFYLLTKPNFKSWLVLGGFILMVYGVALTAWLFLGIIGNMVPKLLVWTTAALAVPAAGYSAFLFAQAKGRDLWQSRLFFWHLIVQALIAGSAAMLILAVIVPSDGRNALNVVIVSIFTLLASLGINLVMVLLEVLVPHGSADSRASRRNMVTGPLRIRFWNGAIGLGLVAPLLLFGIGVLTNIGEFARMMPAVALIGLWFQEDVWVRAGQSVPLS